jgi:hypothetical protein
MNESPARPCATCVHWKRQNKIMGRCTYPLPGSVRQIVGDGVMQKGVWQWIETVGRCGTYSSAGKRDE